MSANNNGGVEIPHNVGLVYTGMELRDYFAAKALHGLITEPPWSDGGLAGVHAWSNEFNGNPLDRFAYVAYKMAGAMMKARAL